MDGEQNALGLVHFSLQIPLECTCIADSWPKLLETSLFVRKAAVSLCISSALGAPTGLQNLVAADPKSNLVCSFCVQNNSIPWMGSKMPLDSSTLACKSHLNAHALPISGPNSLKPHTSLGKLMYHCASLVPLVLQMGSKILFLLIQNPPSGAHFC